MRKGKTNLTVALTCAMPTTGTGRKVYHSHALTPFLHLLNSFKGSILLFPDLSVLTLPRSLPVPCFLPVTPCPRLLLLPPLADLVETLKLISAKSQKGSRQIQLIHTIVCMTDILACLQIHFSKKKNPPPTQENKTTQEQPTQSEKRSLGHSQQCLW